MERKYPLIMECPCRTTEKRLWTVHYTERIAVLAGGKALYASVTCEECQSESWVRFDVDDFLDALIRFQERVYTLEARWHDDVSILEHFYD